MFLSFKQGNSGRPLGALVTLLWAIYFEHFPQKGVFNLARQQSSIATRRTRGLFRNVGR